jgi:tetratricopeptide (TPR) repeat protein
LHEEALALVQAGDLASARRLLDRSVALLQTATGPEHPDVANVLNALGVVTLRQGEIETARCCFRKAWRIAERCRLAHQDDSRTSTNADSANAVQETFDVDGALDIPPADQEGSVEDNTIARIGVQALSNLGNLEREAGNWVRAGRLLKRAVRLARTRLGPDDLDTSNALNNLGMWCKFTGRFDLGRRCYRRALTIIRRHCSPGEARCSPDVASIYHNLGGLEHTAGNFAAGEPFARKSVQIRRRAIGTTHPDYAADVGGLAAIIADQGRADEAESLYREALSIFERAYGDDHYEIAVLLHNLAAVEVSRERLDSAWDLYHRAAVMKERWLGVNHPDLALTLHNLAILALDLDRLSDAASYCRQALTIFENNLVETHPTLLACRACRAEIESR